MGALHEGHFSLVRQARQQSDVVVVSIYVNPKQFGPSEDLASYPRDLEKDLELLRGYRVDAVYSPDDKEMYPDGFQTYVELGDITSTLEGASRPGHFRGVATVVLKLFNIVQPDIAYFGQKDFQQVQVIRRLVEDLNLDLRMVVCPTLRDPDGLAKSSRNTYLRPDHREAALVLSRCLRRGEDLAQSGMTETQPLLAEMRKVVEAEPRAQLEYLTIVEPATLRPVEHITAGTVALMAARVGEVRLIDNLIFGPAGSSPELLIQLALTAQPQAHAGVRVPGLEVESLRQKIEACRACAAITTIQLPPREFMVHYLKRDYPDLNTLRTVVIARDSPMNREHFIYNKPELMHRFGSALYELLGVKNFEEFKARFALTDAVRCHALGNRVAERALEHCSKHLREELKLFPNLQSLVILGDDAYWQFQRFVLGRDAASVQRFDDRMRERSWAEEMVTIPALGDRQVRVFYCYHPTYGYKRSPSLAQLLS